MVDRSCRRCGERLVVPAPGEGWPLTEDANMPPLRGERSWLGRRSSAGAGAAEIVIAIVVVSAGCAIIGVALGD